MKSADRSGAHFALILGETEVAQASVVVKDLVSGEQSTVALESCIDALLHRANN